MKQSASLLATLALLFWTPIAAAEERPPLVVFSAASLRGALDEIAETYPDEVVVSYGGSGALARQAAAGAPADVVLLADVAWMDWLAARGVVRDEMVRQIAGNSIVLIGNLDASQVTPETLPQALGRDRLAIGHRDAVPAGSYARAWLESTGLWTALQDRLAETDNVRAALLLVARGQTSYGVVYATDARAEPAVRVLYDVPSETHPPIRYPAAALTAAGQPFVDYLTGPTAQDIFATHGFKKAAP